MRQDDEVSRTRDSDMLTCGFGFRFVTWSDIDQIPAIPATRVWVFGG